MLLKMFGKDEHILLAHFPSLKLAPSGEYVLFGDYSLKQIIMTNTSNDTFTEPIIFHKVSQLYLAVHGRILKFPKPTRYSLGTRIENSILELVETLYLAQSKQGTSRLLILNKADITLKMLTMHLRLAYKTKSINDAGFASLSEQVVEIGKMVGGWLKHTKNPAS